MATPSDEGAQPPSLKHGVRVVADPKFTVEQVLLGVGEQVGHANITYGSRMNKAVVAFLREERLVHDLVESGLVLDNEFVAVSPLFVPSVRVTVSGVPPFISNESIEKELVRFGKLASGLKPVRLGCKDARLHHVQSLRRQCFMYLSDPSGVIELSFAVKHENRPYTLYVSSGHMKCFECGDIGHKRASCPHKARVGESERGVGGEGASASTENPRMTEELPELPQAGGGQTEVEMPNESQENNVNNVEAESQVTERTEDAPPLTLTVALDTKAPPLVLTAEAESGGVSGGRGTAEANVEGPGEGSSGQCEDEEDEDMDDSLSQLSDTSLEPGQEESACYSLKDINAFLDVTYGKKIVNVQDFFPDLDSFINSVKKIRKQVGIDQLSQQKRYRLSKLVGKIRKDKEGKRGPKLKL